MIIPLTFFPTQTVLIDDNELFLESLSHTLTNNHLPNINYINPYQAIKYLTTTNLFEKFEDAVSYQHSNILEEENFDLSILMDKNFSTLPSVIVIDLLMPDLNGIEVCKKIAHLPCKKILLTANHEYKIAVEAFNKMLINNFILKDEVDLAQKLIKIIKQLQWEFFTEQLSGIYSAINNLNNNLLANSSYQNLCLTHINKLNAKNFYLLDDSGSMIIENQQLSIATEEQLATLYELAVLNNVSADNLTKIKKGEKIPVFHTHQNSQSDWNLILKDAKKNDLCDKIVLYYDFNCI